MPGIHYLARAEEDDEYPSMEFEDCPGVLQAMHEACRAQVTKDTGG